METVRPTSQAGEDQVRPLVIIQPVSWDRVQAGVWYQPSWLHASATFSGLESYLYEDADLFAVDAIFAGHGPQAQYVVDLSSYPQLDLVRQIHRERTRSYDVRFMGLDPLLREHGVGPLADAGDYQLDLAEGAFEYRRINLSMARRHADDYDGHLRSFDNGQPWCPAFFSVGCDRRCPYCYVGYVSFPRAFSSVRQAEDTIRWAAESGVNLHFYDEDFYLHPELDTILAMLEGSGVKWIALATSVSLAAAIEKYGEDTLVESGNVLNEVGVETADPSVLDKRQDLRAILAARSIRVFWLTVTFFPKETLTSRFKTGQFLQRHGYDFDQLMPRLVGNSSHGGLGQFYVPYHGTPWFESAPRKGVFLEDRPTRLWPGYVPHSFLEDVPVQTGGSVEDLRWFDIYHGAAGIWEEMLAGCDGRRTVGDICERRQSDLVAMAQLAQLGLVRSCNEP